MTDSLGTARRAGPADAAALTRLRAVMLEAVDGTAPTDDRWRVATSDWFAGWLAIDPRSAPAAAFVVDDPDTGVPVSLAVGLVSAWAPVPGRDDARSGRILSVATLPEARGRGHARACVAAALEWLDGLGLVRVELSATDGALGVYRSLGFVEKNETPMRRDRPADR